MTTPLRHTDPILLTSPGDLIAAVPHLIGFRPVDSFVIAAHGGPTGTRLAVCLRTDIPPPEHSWALAEQLKTPVLRANAVSVTAVVICAGVAGPPDPLPHRDLVDAFTQVFASAGVALRHALWTPAIEPGASWWCYDDLECNGQVPDPAVSALAAASAAHGAVTYDSKEQMRAVLEPADREPVDRRAARISAALEHPPDEARAQQLVDEVLAEVQAGEVTLDEDRIVGLAIALSHVRVRDRCLRPDVTALGRAVEQLWLDLTRALPPPYRAEPACLLAVTAYIRGDGSLAGVALDAAMAADPEHYLSQMLRFSMDLGLPPAEVATVLYRSVSGTG
jgi:hypothetical protein